MVAIILTFNHYASSRVVLDRDRKYATSKMFFKPDGMWFSEGSSWRKWSLDNNMSEYTTFCHVARVDMEGVLTISTKQGVLDFEERYSFVDNSLQIGSAVKRINWQGVKTDFSGIYITNYAFAYSPLQHIMLNLWRETWDVNSMCLWNLGNILSFKPCWKRNESRDDSHEYRSKKRLRREMQN